MDPNEMLSSICAAMNSAKGRDLTYIPLLWIRAAAGEPGKRGCRLYRDMGFLRGVLVLSIRNHKVFVGNLGILSSSEDAV
jgi:hypothetical protein